MLQHNAHSKAGGQATINGEDKGNVSSQPNQGTSSAKHKTPQLLINHLID